MIESATIRHMHEALGYPTDDASLKKRPNELRLIESDLREAIHFQIIDEMLEQKNTKIIDEGMRYTAMVRTQRQAQEQVLEEYINAPMRDYYEQQNRLDDAEDVGA